MGAADEAYRAAERLIDDAARTGADHLSFDREETRALEQLPESIGRLDRLRRLDLSGTKIDALDPVAGLVRLEVLRLNRTRPVDLSPLAGLTDLRALGLNDRAPTDLEPLEGLTGLKELWVNRTPLIGRALGPIAGMQLLEKLRAEESGVVDLAPLEGKENLWDLSLANSKVSDIAPLASLPGLRRLVLADTDVTDLEALTKLLALETLSLSRTRVSDLRPLASLTGLRALGLDGTEVRDLRPVRRLVKLSSEHLYQGVTFRQSAACVDPRIATIAGMPDPQARAQALFDLIDAGWEPPVGASGASGPDLGDAPTPPSAQPAPLQVALRGDRLVLDTTRSDLQATDAVERARQGWEALRDFRESFAESFNVANYAPLPAILSALDRAMGARFEDRREVAAGLQGLRLTELAADPAFIETLPTGASGELRTFAAAVITFAGRFPDWVRYREEAESLPPAAAAVIAEKAAFDAISDALAKSAHVDPEVARTYRDGKDAATDPRASEAAAQGHLASTRETVRVLTEGALEEVRSGRRIKRATEAMRETGTTELNKWAWRGGGFALDLLDQTSPALRRLARRFPRSLGWITPVLDYLGTRRD